MKQKIDKRWTLSPHLSEIKLRYCSTPESRKNPRLCTPEDVYKYLMEFWDKDRLELNEEFCVLLFNNNRRCLGWSLISLGIRTAALVDVSQICALAILGNATNVVLAHNHPSSNIKKPSNADMRITVRIAKALDLHDVTLDDHLIISPDGYYSMREKGDLYKSQGEL